MKKICLYLDFSPKYMVNFFAITRLSSLQKIDSKLIDEMDCFKWVNVHTSLLDHAAEAITNDLREKNVVMAKRIQLFESYLEQKEILYRYFLSSDIDKYISLIKKLKSHFSSKTVTLQAIINIGRADLFAELLERISRADFSYKQNYNKNNLDFNVYREIIKLFEDEFGKENLAVTYENAINPLLERTTSKSVRDIIAFDEKVEYPLSFYELKTKQARDLWTILCANDNRFLSTPQVIPLLKKIENELDWDSSFELSYEVRKEILNKAESTYKWLSENYFDGLNLLEKELEFEENKEYTGLKDSEISDFVELLPKEIREEVYGKYSSCYEYLSNEEIKLYKALEEKIPNTKYIKKNPKLTVLTLCYNHEKYIKKCIESVQAQKTDFPIKHIIVDHASIDKSREIIGEYAKKYDNIIPYFFNIHEGGGTNVELLFKLADTEYVSLCDGDDYFKDPLKLQKQVDLLEANPSASLCFHPVQVVYEDEPNRTRVYPTEEILPRGKRPFYYLSDMFKANLIQTNSVVYRWRFKEGLPKWFRPDLVPGDWYWHLLHAETGKIAYIDELMSVYRRHKQSLYKEGEYENTVKHRLAHGMRELEFFDVVSKHFKNKFDSEILILTNGIFSSYVQHYVDHQDDSFLNNAVEKYPLFAKFFLSSLSLNE